MTSCDLKAWLLSQRSAVYSLPGREIHDIVPGPDGYVCSLLTSAGWSTIDSCGRIKQAVGVLEPSSTGGTNVAHLSDKYQLIVIPGSRIAILNLEDGATVMEFLDHVPSFMKQADRNLFIVNDSGTMLSFYTITEQSVRALSKK
jgi:hypothetical protein